MLKTLKIAWLAASLRAFLGQGGTKYRFKKNRGLKPPASEVSGL